MNRTQSLAGGRVFRALKVCGSAIGILLDPALSLPRFWIARSELGNLAAMTERDFQDIGLTGCEIERYLTQPNGVGEGALTARDDEERRAASGLTIESFRGSMQLIALVGSGRRAGF